jgi:cytochrome c peroxidase
MKENLPVFDLAPGAGFEIRREPAVEAELHNTGLGEEHRAPMMRNIAVTEPYMRDGSAAALEEAIEHSAKGGRAARRNKSAMLRPFRLRAEEKAELNGLPGSLTGSEPPEEARWSEERRFSLSGA